MAKPDYIPTGKKWNDAGQRFEDLDASHIDDLQKLYDESNAKIRSLESLLKDSEKKNQEILTKILPPETAAKMIALEAKNKELADALSKANAETGPHFSSQLTKIKELEAEVSRIETESSLNAKAAKAMDEEKNGKIQALEALLKEAEEKCKEILTKTSPPEMAARLNVLFKSNEDLIKKLEATEKDLEDANKRLKAKGKK